MTSRLCLPIALLCLSLCLVGCGNKATKDAAGATPEITAQAFADAMAKGDVMSAAALYAYTTEAKQKNDSWGDIPTGQQNSIIRKLQEEKAAVLAQLKDSFKGEVKVGSAQMLGDQAAVPVSVGSTTMTLQLVQEDGKWRICGSQ